MKVLLRHEIMTVLHPFELAALLLTILDSAAYIVQRMEQPPSIHDK